MQEAYAGEKDGNEKVALVADYGRMQETYADEEDGNEEVALVADYGEYNQEGMQEADIGDKYDHEKVAVVADDVGYVTER
ncbi:hypothetical protein ACOSQ2_024743 [Xanthoceras sorbifolium]